jgi:DNA-directed RNA polymerase specialized sigma subunit
MRVRGGEDTGARDVLVERYLSLARHLALRLRNSLGRLRDAAADAPG